MPRMVHNDKKSSTSRLTGCRKTRPDGLNRPGILDALKERRLRPAASARPPGTCGHPPAGGPLEREVAGVSGSLISRGGGRWRASLKAPAKEFNR